MTQEQFINKLTVKNSDYNNPEQAITTANLCDTISKDINTDSQRFIYELLQNADDASNETGKLDVQIDFVGEYVVVSHKGEAFSEIDIESISSAGDGTKTNDSNKTGFKGIGFKSVFAHSNFVIIKSRDFCFKFDKKHWANYWNTKWSSEYTWKLERQTKQKNDTLKMPWQIIPLWTDIPVELQHLSVFQEYNVCTIIKYHKIEQLKTAFTELFSKSQIVLFLRSKEVKIKINNLILEKLKIGETTTLRRNNVILSEWLIKTDNFDIPEDVQEEINADEKSPRKLKEAKRTEISFAIQLEKGRLKAVNKESRLIFTYLPTSINYDFPFLVNANFLTDAGRQHLHKDIFWNNWIFKQIPLKFFTWISELAHKTSKYNKQILAVIPDVLSGYSELEANFNEGYYQAIAKIAFIPNLQGDLLKVNESIFDKTNISGFINKQTIVNYINLRNQKNFQVSSFVPYLESINVLNRLGTLMFEIEDLEGFFASDIFSQEHKLEENYRLITFLWEQAQKSREMDGRNMWNEKLRNIAFIFDESKKLRSPQQIYFPTIKFSHEFNDDINTINEYIVSELNTNYRIKNWLEFLGVKEPSDISFIEKTIIAQGETYITKNNALKIGRYLFNAYKKNILENKHFSLLRQFKILTKTEDLVNAQDVFLSNFYKPEIELEGICHDEFLISEGYFRKIDLISEWKTFFLKIGVQEKISWAQKKFRRYELEYHNDYSKYFDTIPSGVPNSMYGIKNDFYEYEIYLLTFIEHTNQYNFSKKFWSIIFANNLPTSSGTDMGICYYPRSIKSLNRWIIENLPIFPTTQKKCLPQTQVYSDKISNIKEIAGKYLPIFDCDEPIPPLWSSILKFKTNVTIDEYLQILSSIWQEGDFLEQELKGNQNRITLIYENLASLQLHNLDKEKVKEWGKSNKILTQHGKNFEYPQKLQLVTVKGFNNSTLAFANENNSKVVELLRLFGVTIIDKVIPTISNSKIEVTGLKNKLLQISPLVALVAVEKSKNRRDWENEYERIKRKLAYIRFFETTEIYLSYGDEEDKQKRSSWVEKENFYYVGNWHSARVLDGLVEPLGRFLNIHYAERILNVLLSENFTEGIEYLKEKGFDISLMPEELSNPNEAECIINNYGNRPYNESDADLGSKGEQFVYEELKRIYSKKYRQNIEETLTGFKIGNIVEVYWRNISENTTSDHDFKIIENGKEIFVDSKATAFSKNVEKLALFISGNELTLMENAEKYLIARVYNATNKELVSMELINLSLDYLN